MSVIRHRKSPTKELAIIGFRQMRRRKMRTSLTFMALILVAASFALTVSISSSSIYVIEPHEKSAGETSSSDNTVQSIINRFDYCGKESFGIELYPSNYVTGNQIEETLKVITDNETLNPSLSLDFSDLNNPTRNVVFQTYLEVGSMTSKYSNIKVNITGQADEKSLNGIAGIEPGLCADFKGWDVYFTNRSELCNQSNWEDFVSNTNSVLISTDERERLSLEINDTFTLIVTVKNLGEAESRQFRVAGFYDKLGILDQKVSKVTSLTGNSFGRLSGGSDMILHLSALQVDLINGGNHDPKEWDYGIVELHLNKALLLTNTSTENNKEDLHNLLDGLARDLANKARKEFYGDTTVRYVFMTDGSTGDVEITQLRIQPFYKTKNLEKIIIMLILMAFITFNLILGFVYETKREIFVLTTSGAPPRDIATMFRLQAVILGLVGGIGGSIAGVGIAWVTNLSSKQFGLNFPIPDDAMALNPFGLFMTTIVFLILNMAAAEYPSRMASRISVPSLKRSWLPSGQELQEQLDKDKHTIDVPIHVPLELVSDLLKGLKGYIESKVGLDIGAGMMGTQIEEAKETKFGTLWSIRTMRFVETAWGNERVLIIISILKRPERDFAICKVTGSSGAASMQTAASLKALYEVIDEFRSFILGWHVERLRKVEIVRKPQEKPVTEE